MVLEDITESLLFQLIYFALYSQPGDNLETYRAAPCLIYSCHFPFLYLREGGGESINSTLRYKHTRH